MCFQIDSSKMITENRTITVNDNVNINNNIEQWQFVNIIKTIEILTIGILFK
jgi:hypothetical protein